MILVNVRTQEEYDELMEILEEQGIGFGSGDSGKISRRFDLLKQETYIRIERGYIGGYGSLRFARMEYPNTPILSLQEYKDNHVIKAGDTVRVRDLDDLMRNYDTNEKGNITTGNGYLSTNEFKYTGNEYVVKAISKYHIFLQISNYALLIPKEFVTKVEKKCSYTCASPCFGTHTCNKVITKALLSDNKKDEYILKTTNRGYLCKFFPNTTMKVDTGEDNIEIPKEFVTKVEKKNKYYSLSDEEIKERLYKIMEYTTGIKIESIHYNCPTIKTSPLTTMSENARYDSEQSILSKARNAFLSKREKSLRKHNLKDDCGNWTSQAKEIYLENLMNADKDCFNDLIKELEDEK